MSTEDVKRCEAFLRVFPHLTLEQIEALGRSLFAKNTVTDLADNQINTERLREGLDRRLGGGQ